MTILESHVELPSAQPRRAGPESDRCDIGREGYAPHSPRSHAGLLFMTSLWLALYVIIVIHQFIASGS